MGSELLPWEACSLGRWSRRQGRAWGSGSWVSPRGWGGGRPGRQTAPPGGSPDPVIQKPDAGGSVSSKHPGVRCRNREPPVAHEEESGARVSPLFCGLTAVRGCDCAGTAGMGTGRHPASAQQGLHLVQLQPHRHLGSRFHPWSLPGVPCAWSGVPPDRRDNQPLPLPSQDGSSSTAWAPCTAGGRLQSSSPTT